MNENYFLQFEISLQKKFNLRQKLFFLITCDSRNLLASSSEFSASIVSLCECSTVKWLKCSFSLFIYDKRQLVYVFYHCLRISILFAINLKFVLRCLKILNDCFAVVVEKQKHGMIHSNLMISISNHVMVLTTNFYYRCSALIDEFLMHLDIYWTQRLYLILLIFLKLYLFLISKSTFCLISLFNYKWISLTGKFW